MLLITEQSHAAMFSQDLIFVHALEVSTEQRVQLLTKVIHVVSPQLLLRFGFYTENYLIY